MVPIIKFREFTPYNKIATKAAFPDFVVLKVGLFIEKFEEHKSLFKLDGCLLQSIKAHISFINKISITNQKSNEKSNFSPKESTQLRNLMNQLKIVIKEADKGGAVTILSTNYCRAMIYKHLNNQNTYQRQDKYLYSFIMKKIKELSMKHKNISQIRNLST